MKNLILAIAWTLSVPWQATAEQAATGTRYSRADLPPLMEFLDGRPVRTPDDFAARKAEVRRLLCQYFIGTFPDTSPALLQAEVLRETTPADGSTRRRIRLTFDTKSKASFLVDVWIPKGTGPWPLLLTQPRFYQIPWAELALTRGYTVCLYSGVDSHHQEADYPEYDKFWQQFRSDYPQATWTEIAVKAWMASRTLDYLLNPKNGYNVASGQVGIIGHSRYGKQSLIAAAFDERITSVVARSPGSPGSSAYRFCSRKVFAEAPEDFADQWFLESLRSYTGRENELPIEAHGWLALIAPRRCLIHTAHQDDGEPTFAVERNYLEGRTVYSFLGHPDNLRVLFRTGGHDPITDEHRRQNLDWFDLSFGRGTAKQADFPEEFIHKFDWQAWKDGLPADDLKVPFSAARSSGTPDDRRARILWSLGRAPDAAGTWTGTCTFLTDAESEQMSHDRWKVENTARMPVCFGDGVRGNIYYNPDVKGAAPAVIWLHPYSFGSGYNEGYGVIDTTIYHRLAWAGFVVLAYDQLGFGLRLLEGRDFYRKHPRWSRMGRMVQDVRAAVDFLADGKGRAKGTMPPIHKDLIFIVGYSLGGMVGLYAAALDDRITGVASFCGFTPLRTDTDSKPTGGVRRLWEWYALQPRLGLFAGREQDIPYDFDDVLSLIAPRPCLIVSPTRDREANIADVTRCVEAARPAWKAAAAEKNLTHLIPDDINRFQQPQQVTFLEWLKATIKAAPK